MSTDCPSSALEISSLDTALQGLDDRLYHLNDTYGQAPFANSQYNARILLNRCTLILSELKQLLPSVLTTSQHNERWGFLERETLTKISEWQSRYEESLRIGDFNDDEGIQARKIVLQCKRNVSLYSKTLLSTTL